MTSFEQRKQCKNIGFTYKKCNKNNSIEKDLLKCSEFFPRRITFIQPKRLDNSIEMLRLKYPCLNQNKERLVMNLGTVFENKENICISEENSQLCKNSLVDSFMEWKKIYKTTVGLNNAGNFCYMNCVLHCLIHTSPLGNYLIEAVHSKECTAPSNQFCVFCDLENLASEIVSKPNSYKTIHPKAFVSRVKLVAKHFKHHRQEDSHEYFRLLIASLQKSCLYNYPKNLDNKTKETSFIYKVFGGYFRNQIKCQSCFSESSQFEPILDISLNIRSTIEKSLYSLIENELLTGENQYYCEKCQKKVNAVKTTRIHTLPRILCLHLKRFNYYEEGRKIKKFVSFDEHLNLKHFVSETNSESLNYKLYAVIVHSGHSVHSGHYHCMVQSSNNMWYCLDNELVSQVSIKTVLAQQAYILFYKKMKSPSKEVLMPNQYCEERNQSHSSTESRISSQKTSQHSNYKDLQRSRNNNIEISLKESYFPLQHKKKTNETINATSLNWTVTSCSNIETTTSNSQFIKHQIGEFSESKEGSRKNNQKNVSVLQWDSSIKNDVGVFLTKNTQDLNQHSSFEGKIKPRRRLEKYFKDSEFGKLGDSVKSWTGTSNSVDLIAEDVLWKRNQEDEELDKGKLKKIKKNIHETSFWNENPFQMFYNKNKK